MPKQITFTVQGRGVFPFDMLRYDHCWPDTSEDAVCMGHYTEPRKVNLRCHYSNGAAVQSPTKARWASFGWQVETVQPPR